MTVCVLLIIVAMVAMRTGSAVVVPVAPPRVEPIQIDSVPAVCEQ
jgi:hypothetical protein